METTLERFFRADVREEVRKRGRMKIAAFHAGSYSSLGPLFDLSHYRNVAEFAYVCGEHTVAYSAFRQAAEAGRPLLAEEPDTSRVKRVEQAGAMVDLAEVALISGLGELSQAASSRALLLLPSDPLPRQRGEASLYRHMATLAAGGATNTLPIRGSDYGWATWTIPLSRAATALIQARRGESTRTDANKALYDLIMKTNGEDLQRVIAIGHALFLQTAFPDVFDPLLPPLKAVESRPGPPAP